MTQPKCICIVCSKEMANFMEDGLQPNDGLCFETHGHYGSTIFDPVVGNCSLEICVCDACLEKAREDGKVYIVAPVKVTKRISEVWKND